VWREADLKGNVGQGLAPAEKQKRKEQALSLQTVIYLQTKWK